MMRRNSDRIRGVIALAGIVGAWLAPGCGGEPPDGETAQAQSAITLGADPNWTNGLPYNAMVAGSDNGGIPEYPCRAVYGNSIQLGKTEQGWNGCDISYGGSELLVSTFQTLTPNWMTASGGAVPSGSYGPPVAFGKEADQTPLYVCRASYAGGVHTGKVRPGFDGCYIPYGGREVHVATYDILYSVTVPVAPLLVSGGILPPNAVAGGHDTDGAALYPCLAWYQNGLHPGKTRKDWSSCDISWGGGEIFVASYSVLALEFNSSAIEYEPGFDTNNSPLGICAASYASGTQVGKYLGGGLCSFGYGGKEVMVSSGVKVVTEGTSGCGTSAQSCCGGNCNPGLTCEVPSWTCTPCGASGQACCGGSGCSQGLACSNGVCMTPTPPPCGGANQPCCSGGMCGADMLCSSNRCIPCGQQPGEPCCPSGLNGGCPGENFMQCSGGVCQACGAPGQSCCGAAGLCSTTSACYPANHTCTNGCGYSGGPCCSSLSGAWCATQCVYDSYVGYFCE